MMTSDFLWPSGSLAHTDALLVYPKSVKTVLGSQKPTISYTGVMLFIALRELLFVFCSCFQISPFEMKINK